MLVSFFSQLINSASSEALQLPKLLIGIRDGRWAEQVLAVRGLDPNSRAYSEAKRKLPCFTASGTFERRILAGLLQHSGIVALDLDAKQNPGVDLVATKTLLAAAPTTYACFASVGGMGLCVLVRIPTGNHEGSFRELSAYYQQDYGLNVDRTCGDMGRLRFVSYDPALYLNEQATTCEESQTELTQLFSATPALDTTIPPSN